MKNYIPLILAIILGAASVVAVSRFLRERQETAEQTDSVLAVNRDLQAGDEFTEEVLFKKTVPVSARPRQAVYWTERTRVFGQKTVRPIRQGDYVLLSDVAVSRTFGNLVSQNEWAVTIETSGGVADFVQAGDEVAIIATLNIEKSLPSTDASAPVERIQQEATLTLFPKVRILDTGEMANDGARKIVVGLPPEQAQVLVAAQRRAELVLALRHPGDTSAVRREDAGMVDDQTFQKLFQGIKPVVVPSEPSAIAGGKVEK
jgi:Flp pilus assembly protein CpaB